MQARDVIKLTVYAALSLAMCMICSGQSVGPLSAEAGTQRARPNAIQLQGAEWVVPELIIGGEWTSSIRLTNRGSQSIPTTNVSFWDNNGNSLRTTFQTSNGDYVTDTGFSFSLGVGAIAEATFSGGSDTAFGMATIGCSARGCGTQGLYGEVTLRNHNSTRPDFVVVFPLEAPTSLQYMLFDGRSTRSGAITTTLYLTNQNIANTGVTIDIRDIDNYLVRSVFLTLGPGTTQLLSLHSIAPETIGIQGTLVIRGQTNDSSTSGVALVTVTALRVDPSNSFAPVRAWVPAY
jgi:hypothetical protein